jgi:hypothetical protein
VVSSADVADPADICGQPLAAPSFPAQREALVRNKLCCAKKKFFDAAFAVGQAMADKQEIAG